MSWIQVLLIAACCLVSSRVVAQTEVSGAIGGQIWTSAGSPYLVTADISVGRLTIEPGVNINFQGNFVFRVGGTLTARGTAEQPIEFLPAEGVAEWQGILFSNNPEGSSLIHCVVRNASVTLTDARQVLVSNCLIRNSSSGGMRITRSDALVERCEISNNTNGTQGGGVSAILGESNRVVFRETWIHDNGVSQADGNASGAGLYIEGGQTEFDDCLVNSNLSSVTNPIPGGSSTSRGGGVYLTGGTVIATNSVFRNNTSRGRGSGGMCSCPGRAYGGGFFVNSGVADFTNCLLSCNVADGSQGNEGGGVYLASGQLRMMNCTVARNTNDGIYRESGDVTIRNTIVYANSDAEIQGVATVNYSCIQGGFDGEGNSSFDPVFASVEGCGRPELAIILGSPCIDAGDPAAEFNDSCFPPSFETERNDIGKDGGPGACTGADRIPGDCNADGNLDVSDGICVFGVLFLGNPGSFPCGDGSTSHPGNLALLDWQSDGRIDISDGIGILQFLFLGGPPHPLAVPGEEGTALVEIPSCP